MARKISKLAEPILRPADRARGKALLAAVDCDAGECDPAFRRLLEWWEDLRVSVTPPVPCYRCKGGERVTAGVGPVLAAIRRHLWPAVGGRWGC